MKGILNSFFITILNIFKKNLEQLILKRSLNSFERNFEPFFSKRILISFLFVKNIVQFFYYNLNIFGKNLEQLILQRIFNSLFYKESWKVLKAILNRFFWKIAIKRSAVVLPDSIVSGSNAADRWFIKCILEQYSNINLQQFILKRILKSFERNFEQFFYYNFEYF